MNVLRTPYEFFQKWFLLFSLNLLAILVFLRKQHIIRPSEYMLVGVDKFPTNFISVVFDIVILRIRYYYFSRVIILPFLIYIHL